MLLHFIKLHWRTVLAVVVAALVVWACLPAAWRSKLWEGWKRFGHAVGNVNARLGPLAGILAGLDWVAAHRPR